MAAEPKTAIIPIDPSTREISSVPLALPPFADWKYSDAAAAVSARVPNDYLVRELYGENMDHWDRANGWVGPRGATSASSSDAVLTGIRAQFAPHDACGEALSAIEDAFSSEAQISAVPIDMAGDEPTEEQKRLIDECVELLTRAWDRVRLHEAVKASIRWSAYAERSGIRWWIPPGRALQVTFEGGRTENRIPRAERLEVASEWLALHAPKPNAAAVVTDEPTQAKASVYLDHELVGDRQIKRAQISYIDNGILNIRTVWDQDVKPPVVDPLNTGVLPMAEMSADNLLTPAVIQTQRQLDYFESVLTRTVETAGFRERYITNAKPTGLWVRLETGAIPEGPVQEFGGVQYQLKPQPRVLGSSITTEVVGIEQMDANGNVTNASPSITSFDPTDPEFAIKAAKHARAKILQMCRQAHRAGDSTAESSGLAYQQARAAFEKDLSNRKGAAEAMLRDLLTAHLGLCEALSEQPGYFTDNLRVVVDIHVDAGPQAPEERQQDREDVKAGLLSSATAMSRSGIEDVEAERDRIAMQPGSRLGLLKEAAEVFQLVAEASSARAAVRALIAAGVEPEIANAMMPLDTDISIAA